MKNILLCATHLFPSFVGYFALGLSAMLGFELIRVLLLLDFLLKVISSLEKKDLRIIYLPSQQCYAGPIRVLRGLPVREPYRFGRGRCSGPTWANRTGLIWLSISSRNQKSGHANKLTFLIIFKKEHFA